ncbi:hypothetical protein ATCC90586_002430 [Pythium insidiosum]|nr:hypothetical protein ATCC90586_002430 [Pythium insidiosum]
MPMAASNASAETRFAALTIEPKVLERLLLIWMGVQSLLVALQLVATAAIVYSWEFLSVMMGFSALLLWQAKTLYSTISKTIPVPRSQR